MQIESRNTISVIQGSVTVAVGRKGWKEQRNAYSKVVVCGANAHEWNRGRGCRRVYTGD
jgi:hypothetical protein